MKLAPAILIVLLLACARAEPPVATSGLALPPAPVDDQPSAAPSTDVIASWSGRRITATDVTRERALQPEGTTARQVAEALVDLDVVTAAAARDGYWAAARFEVPWAKLLVKALLKDRFEFDYDTSRVPEGDLTRIWDEHKEVRILFDHYDSYEVADVQYVCCARRYTECDPIATEACIAKSRPTVERIFDRYVAGREHNEFEFKYLAEQVLHPTDSRVAFNRYSFFYDPAIPWDQQNKFHRYNRAVVEAAAAIPVHGVARPVASNNGLHILYLIKHDPGVHRDLTDPEVEATVREKALPSYRQRDLAILVDDLMIKAGVQLHDDVTAAIPLGFRK